MNPSFPFQPRSFEAIVRWKLDWFVLGARLVLVLASELLSLFNMSAGWQTARRRVFCNLSTVIERNGGPAACPGRAVCCREKQSRAKLEADEGQITLFVATIAPSFRAMFSKRSRKSYFPSINSSSCAAHANSAFRSEVAHAHSDRAWEALILCLNLTQFWIPHDSAGTLCPTDQGQADRYALNWCFICISLKQQNQEADSKTKHKMKFRGMKIVRRLLYHNV
ncbi:hypothetical protein BaRGS_00007153 [Batillaria attramentaria]|uniref:Uncharacterized protein n=1 Tax=Batillaria attramentaria TaxID=370345 RepID=A0ABD0LQJ0_9CAEN